MRVIIALTAPDEVHAALQVNGTIGEFRALRDQLEAMTEDEAKVPGGVPAEIRQLLYAMRGAIREAEGHYQRPVVDEAEGEEPTP